MRHSVDHRPSHITMRLVHVAAALILTVGSLAHAHAAEPLMKFVEYQGQRFDLSKAYEDFHDYKDDQANLTPVQVQRAESLLRPAKFGPSFKTSDQLGAHIDPKLEFVYVEVPVRNLNRYIALERQADGSLLVVADFVASAEPEIARVNRSADGSLAFHQQNGKVVVPAHR